MMNLDPHTVQQNYIFELFLIKKKYQFKDRL